mmetsp:Transcript_14845/g.28750  ORF Transcript_14845/g.28750 Transcript_14845/m.28750 type:complete len:321 (-) Transcript_14845:2992-3954(-)
MVDHLEKVACSNDKHERGPVKSILETVDGEIATVRLARGTEQEANQHAAGAHLSETSKNTSHVTLTFAQSLDGSISRIKGEPVAISSPESFAFTHALRARHSAIVVGIGTMLADNPSLTTRHVDGEDPDPVIIDANLQTPLSCKLFTDPRCRKRPLLIALQKNQTASESTEDQSMSLNTHSQGEVTSSQSTASCKTTFETRAAALRALGAEIVFCEADSTNPGRVSLEGALRILRQRFDSIMIEGGAGIITGILTNETCVAQVDRVILTIAPAFFGGYNYMQQLASERVSRAWKPDLVETAGGDIVLSLAPSSSGQLTSS